MYNKRVLVGVGPQEADLKSLEKAQSPKNLNKTKFVENALQENPDENVIGAKDLSYGD